MEIKEIELNKIHPNPTQPREKFDRDKLRELSESILSNGLINPITVRVKGNGYEIISGERRWKAHQIADLDKIQVIVKEYRNEGDSMIARALGISEQEVKNIISELAGWDNYPFVIIRTPKKSGFIQLHSKNLEDTEKWITTALRHITSRQQRLDKTVNATQIKRRERKRNRIKNAEEIVEEVRERIETEE
jgi:hypothetical protein